jgi:hypothetical protein
VAAQTPEQGLFDVHEYSCDSQPCDAVLRGALAFLRRNFEDLPSNGRACADCHMPTESFQLSPAAARARFERLIARRARNPRADDPLFRPVDADDFRENGAAAHDFSNLVDNGLVRVTMPLPLNVRLIDPSTGQRRHACAQCCDYGTGLDTADLAAWRSARAGGGAGSEWPEPTGRLSARRAFRDAAGTGAQRPPCAR